MNPSTATANAPRSIYVHIPFCEHRCSYCDFNTYTTLADLQPAYAAAVARAVRQVATAAGAPAGKTWLDTLFFGGGTPSLMAPAQLGQIMRAVQDHFVFAPDAEITMEANPGTVDKRYLEAVRALGINRLSFGAQSAVPAELALLERTHTFDTVIEAVGLSRRAGFDNLSVDLIYGTPGQTLRSWEQSVRAAVALEIEHISLYCLTIEPGTPMDRWRQTGQIPLPDPDLAADQYELAGQLMGKAGFEHYEISNWSRPGRPCRHNLTYWHNEPFLGIGAGAHGFVNGIRYHVVRQPRVYIRRMQEGDDQPYPLSRAVAGHHREAEREAMSTMAMMQLRLLQEGLDLKAFETRFGQRFTDVYAEELLPLMEWELLKTAGDHMLLTEKGKFLSNQVFYRLM